MNSIERIKAAVSFGQPDRTAVIPQLFAHAAVQRGLTIGDYVENGNIAADCQLDALRHYDADAVFAALDVCVEAAAVGCQVEYRRDIYPAMIKPAFTPDTDFSRLVLPNPETTPRMSEVLRMAGKLRRAVADETLVVGVVQGPMTLAVQFLGMETALYLAADDHTRFEQLLEYTTQVTMTFGLSQLAAGVHVCLVFEPVGCPEIVPPAFFREMLAPRISRIFQAFKNAGAPANWLHIAGQVMPILPLYREIGADIGNFDYVVDPIRVARAIPDGLCLDGNIKPLAFVEDQPEAIEAEARCLIHCFERRGGFILSSGCEIPPEAKPENIEAMVKAAKKTPCPRMREMLRG
jgi:uroporphyrinogen decarboxylase